MGKWERSQNPKFHPKSVAKEKKRNIRIVAGFEPCREALFQSVQTKKYQKRAPNNIKHFRGAIENVCYHGQLCS